MQLLILVGVGTVSAAAVWRSSIVLEEASDSLCTHYRLPALVQGTLVAAVASSLPELASAVFSTLLHDEFELGVSVVVGSAIFNILVIPAMAGLVGRLEVGLEVIYRDAQFYVISIATLLIAFSLAVIYRPVADQRLAGEMGRVLALLPLALYGLYLFLQVEDAADHRESSGESGSESPARTWLRLVASVLVVLAAAEGLVWTALGLGAYFGTPSFLWGVTVVAVATSAPDAVISYRAAREDRPVVSVGNVLGSNIFDLLVV
ncbi:MAG: sodium:calcium antiporter, partial [Thermoanaerobaculia bacterium]|nr:sodium:calcium antiporter [Thermoanaerobaculia bacterium]